jgi:integrase/recombinase XerD
MPLSWLSSSYRILEDDNHWVEFSHTTIGVVMDYTFPVPAMPEESQNVEIFQHTKSVEDKSSLIERYFQSYSPQTIKAYKADLQTWWDFSSTEIAATKPEHVLRYIKYLEMKGYENATINRKIAALSKVFSIYVSIGEAQINPIHILSATTRIYKPVDNQVKNRLSLHEVEEVIQRASKRTSVIVKFLANTGLRVSELINIRKDDLEPKDTDYLSVRIRGKGNKVRFIYISYALYKEVKDVFDSESIYLFASRTGQILSRTNLYRQVRRSFEKHVNKKTSPHELRHFFATRKIVHEKKDYKAVSQYLGHQDPGLTMRVYVSNELKPEEAQII